MNLVIFFIVFKFHYSPRATQNFHQSLNWNQFEILLPSSRDDLILELTKKPRSEPLLLMGDYDNYPSIIRDELANEWKVSAKFHDFQSWVTETGRHPKLILNYPYPSKIYLGVFKNSHDYIEYSIKIRPIQKDECIYRCKNSDCSFNICKCYQFEDIGDDCSIKAQKISIKSQKTLWFHRFEWKFLRVDKNYNRLGLVLASHQPRLRIFGLSTDDSEILPGFFNYQSQYFIKNKVDSYKINVEGEGKDYWLFGIYCEGLEDCDISITVNHSNSPSNGHIVVIVSSVISVFILCISVPIIIKFIVHFRRKRHARVTNIPENLKKLELEKLCPTVKYSKTYQFTNCSICLEEFKFNAFIKILQCKHMFHSSCIEEWYQAKSFCPLCKSSMSQDETLIIREV